MTAEKKENIIKGVNVIVSGALAYCLLTGSIHEYLVIGLGLLFAYSAISNLITLLKTIKIVSK